MNYRMIQREVETLGKDLIDLSSRVLPAGTEKPKELQGVHAAVPILALPDLTDELQCIHTRLTALLQYVGNNKGG